MNQASYKIAAMCQVLGVSTSGYYGWRGRQPSNRAQQDTCYAGSDPSHS